MTGKEVFDPFQDLHGPPEAEYPVAKMNKSHQF